MEFDKPKNLNGAELRQELREAGIEISDDFPAVALNSNGKLLLDIAIKDFETAKKVVANHNGTIISPEPTIEQKLASVGLSLDELKSALLA